MKKRVLSTLMGSACAAFLLAACGGDEPAAPEQSATQEPATNETETEGATTEAGEIPQDYKYYFSFDEADAGVHLAIQDKTATPIVQAVDDEPTYVTGVKGNALYLDGTKGAKLDVNGVGDTYTVSFWVNASRSANYMPTLQFGPDIHGDASGGQHYVNFTWSEWNPDGASFPCVWAYDELDGAKWPNWYPDEADTHVKEWMNITFTVDPTELSADGSLIIAHLYVNGEEWVGSSSDGERPVYCVFNTMQESDNFDFLLGVNYWDAIFKGCFDEIYVYDYVLDASQIAALYAAGDTTATYDEPERVVVVEENPDAIDSIGTTALDMGFWSDWSEAIKIEEGTPKLITLKNYSDGGANWDNYVLAFTNEYHEEGVDPNASGTGTEWTVVRADAYAWNGEKNPDTDADLFEFEYSWGNWGTWLQQVMVDADVTLKVSREGGVITIEADNVDYNGTSNTMNAKITTELTSDDDCYLTILGEKCYIEILSIEDAVVVEANPDAIDAIGDTSLVQAFWVDWTDAYEVADGSSVKMKLHNYSDGANNWDNFVVAFTNTKTVGHSAPADQSADYAEYAVLRADAFGWGDEAYAGEFTTSWGDDWAGWLKMMKNADVDMTVTRNGGKITVDYVFTGSDGSEWTEQAVVTSTMTADSDVYFFLTNEASYVEVLSVN